MIREHDTENHVSQFQGSHEDRAWHLGIPRSYRDLLDKAIVTRAGAGFQEGLSAGVILGEDTHFIYHTIRPKQHFNAKSTQL